MDASVPAEAVDLGKLLKVYGENAANIRTYRIFAAIVGIFGLVVAYLILGNFRNGFQPLSLLCFVLPLGILGLAVWLGLRGSSSRSPKVFVLEKGLTRTGGGKTLVVRWDDVADVLESVISVNNAAGVRIRTEVNFTLRMANGEEHKFNNTVAGIMEMGTTIQQQVAARLMPKYLETFKSGQPVTFGILSLSKAGLGVMQETIPWQQVEQVKLEAGAVSVLNQEKWRTWTFKGVIPNARLFRVMLDQLLDSKKQK